MANLIESEKGATKSRIGDVRQNLTVVSTPTGSIKGLGSSAQHHDLTMFQSQKVRLVE